jgi:serine/threonine protein kinase
VPQDVDETVQRHAHGRSREWTLGKYRMIAELSRGGMGVVYLALMRGPGAFSKLLVLKVLRRELLDDPSIVAMFMEEARLAALLSHPNVVQTIEAGSDRGLPYIAMEYLDGQSLERIISRARKHNLTVPFELKSAVLCSALEGLAYAHAAKDYDGVSLGIVHRDVSPHNIVVGYDGHVKVVDFGIAKARGSLVDTRIGLLKGRVAYMAPEQAAGAQLDARADVFSMGVALWEAVTGRRFWSGMDSDMQAFRALLTGDIDDTHARAIADVEPGLRAVVIKATAFAPSERYESAAHLLEELRGALAMQQAPPLPPKDIGQFVQGLFAEDRERLQATINDALKSVREESMGDSTPSNVPVLWETTSTGSSASAVISGKVPASREARPTQDGMRRGWRLVAAGVCLAALVLVGVIALRRVRASRPDSSKVLALSSSVTVLPAVDMLAAQDRPHPENIHVIVRASPPAARIVIDGDLVLENPCVATLLKDSASHNAHIEADGYLPRDESFDAREDVTLVVALEPRKIPVRAASIARPAAAPVPPPAIATASVALVPGLPPAPAQSAFVPQRRINPANPYNH